MSILSKVKSLGKEAKLATSPDLEAEVSFTDTGLGKPPGWKEYLEDMKERQERLEREEQSQEYAKVEINSELPIGIVLTSDWHLGSKGVAYDTWARHMELIKDEPQAFMMTLSNTIDNFVFPSGMFEQMENPSSQQRMVRDFAREYKNKFLAIVGSRCHEGWTQNSSDVNVNYEMFRDVIGDGVPWLPVGGVVELSFNGISYKFGLTHKVRGAGNNPQAFGQKMYDRWPVDIVAAAHHHVKQLFYTNKYEGKFEQEFAVIRTGAYKIKDAYGESEGFGQGDIGSPIVILLPDRKHFIPFYSLEDGIDYLRLSRKGGRKNA